ncbi:TetR/AcrR family transcriptional regulator [soil metagenome]
MRKSGKLTAAERRRATRREDVRHDILQAARELVESRGARALTMRAVAKAVGYSPGAIYEYFDSKRDILEAMYFQGTQGLEGRTRQVLEAAGPNATAIDRVAMAGRAYRSFALDHPDLYLLIFSVPHSGGTALPHQGEPSGDASFGSLVSMLREAIERGEVVGGNPERMAAALWAFVHGFVMLEITRRLPDESPGLTEKLFESGLELIGLGLKPRTESDPGMSAT